MDKLTLTLGALLIVYNAYLAGNSIISRLRIAVATRQGRIGYAITIGLGLIVFIGFILAIFSILYAWLLWLLLLISLIIYRKKIYSHILFFLRLRLGTGLSMVKAALRPYWFLKTLIVIWLLGNFLLAFVPLTGHDTLDYHLPIIESVANSHGLDFARSVEDFNYLPILGEILYAIPTVLFSEHAAPYVFQILQYLVIVFVSLIVWNTVLPRVKNKLFGFASVLTVLSLMDFQREVLHGGYIDVLGFLFGLAALFLLIDHLERDAGSKRGYILCGLFLGLALSVKYTGLFFVAISLLFILIHHLKRKETFLGLIRDGLYLGIPAVIVSGFWYVRNLFSFGNPVFPMWSDAETTASVGLFIMDRTVGNFLYFPFYRYAQWFLQEVETSSRLIVLGLFIVLYLLIIILAIAKRRFTLTSVFLFIFVELYLLFLFISSHQYRFLIPATIGASVLVALLADSFASWIENKINTDSRKKIFQGVISGLVLAGFLLVYLGNLHYFEVKWKYVLGKTTTERYIHDIGGQ
ncbi:MAG TPA: glycosyltransferase family 39 protein [Candidatus Paceibacterota bacterium]